MLTLNNIIKNYGSGEEITKALRGVNLEFSEKGLTSILGPSGCGKTTLLNIIGGLDHYTEGDLLIDGKSTKDFKDCDWDAYRNAKVGFVFQSYNLISHLSIMENVGMALSLSGISGKEREERSKAALDAVGLSAHLDKRPNQLSGGQMQRVAIARALVNNPSIILADEPTGALDSATSLQVMDILKEVSQSRLVIMVTHNRELAEKYSDRIIEMNDGLVVGDNNPVEEVQSIEVEKMTNKSTKMSFLTALKSSFKNLLSKKVRTSLISIAGSIGIIGVALVLAISNGMTNFLNQTEKETLSGFPLSITQTVAADMTMPDPSGMNTGTFPNDGVFYPYDKSGNTTLHKNKLTDEYIEYVSAMDSTLYSAISYNYAVEMHVVSIADDGSYKLVDTSVSNSDIFSTTSVFSQMPDNKDFIKSQYDILAGDYPEGYNQVALVVDKNNRIDTVILEQFGIEIPESFMADDLIGRTFKIILNDDYYEKTENRYVAGNDYKVMYQSEKSITVTVSAIMRIKQDCSGELLATGVNYTPALTKKLLEDNKSSAIVKAQEESPSINVLTGAPFFGTVSYDSVMQKLGGDSTPTGIQIYPANFEAKSQIKKYLDAYNSGKAEDDRVVYTDLSESMSSAISSMVDTVSVILIAFAAISLVVSTVMIGIITYVSVVERTKEIGIMRAIGARKKDISRIFNAEAIIIGFTAGLIGVLLTYLLSIPASAIITSMVGISFTVLLQPYWALALIAVSVLLTLIAGFFPSKIAAKKDPVVALRTE
ncbi:MAG: ATP-binding cassette domain-containing protein [Candidatus Coproplasma sp.]